MDFLFILSALPIVVMLMSLVSAKEAAAADLDRSLADLKVQIDEFASRKPDPIFLQAMAELDDIDRLYGLLPEESEEPVDSIQTACYGS